MSYLPDHIVSDLQTQVVTRDGKVHLLFSRDVEGELRPADTNHVLLPADTALQFGQVVIDAAFEADTGLKPLGPAAKAELVAKHRQKLVPRITLMLNSLREAKQTSNGQLARQIIDAAFSEVFS